MTKEFPRSRKKASRLSLKEREQLQREREKAEARIARKVKNTGNTPKRDSLPKLIAPYTSFEAIEHIFDYHGTVTLDAVTAEAPELIKEFHPQHEVQPHHPAVRNRLICTIQNYGWSLIYRGSPHKLLEGWDAVHIRPEKVFGYESQDAQLPPRTDDIAYLMKGLLPCSAYDCLRDSHDISDIAADVFVQSHYSPRTGFQAAGIVAHVTGCQYPAAKKLDDHVLNVLQKTMGDSFEKVEKTMLVYGDTPLKKFARR